MVFPEIQVKYNKNLHNELFFFSQSSENKGFWPSFMLNYWKSSSKKKKKCVNFLEVFLPFPRIIRRKDFISIAFESFAVVVKDLFWYHTIFLYKINKFIQFNEKLHKIYFVFCFLFGKKILIKLIMSFVKCPKKNAFLFK